MSREKGELTPAACCQWRTVYGCKAGANERCLAARQTLLGWPTGGIAPLDNTNDSKDVVVVLDKADARVLLEVAVSLLHPSTSDTARSALVSLACQIRRAISTDSGQLG